MVRAIAAVLFVLPAVAAAQCQVAGLTAPGSPPTNARFGSSIGLVGDVLAVGARSMSSTASVRGGAVYMHQRSGAGQWVVTQKVISGDIEPADEFGVSLDLRADRMIVGAWLDDDTASATGSAYVFRLVAGQWVEDDKLTAMDAAVADRFGVSVAINGDLAIVGAPYTMQVGFQTGSAYIFKREAGPGGWVQVAKLERPTNLAGMFFGNSVAIAGDTAIVSAPGDNFGGMSRGAVYVFRDTGGGWQFQERLQPADVADNDGFGTAMSLDGDALLVGSYLADGTAGLDQGAAYIYRRGAGGAWAEEDKLWASDAAPADLFGGGVALKGDLALVPAYQADLPGGVDHGAGYLFRRNGTEWVGTAKLRASDAGASDILGTSAAIDGEYASLGAMFSNAANTDAGAAYVFSVEACTCYGNCDGSLVTPRLNVADFICYMNIFAAGDPWANCDGSTTAPVLNVADYICFMNRFAGACP